MQLPLCSRTPALQLLAMQPAPLNTGLVASQGPMASQTPLETQPTTQPSVSQPLASQTKPELQLMATQLHIATQPPVSNPLSMLTPLAMPAPTTQLPLSKCQQTTNKVKIVQSLENTLLETLAADGYRLGNPVGSGSFSNVRMAIKSFPGNKTKELACKIIDKSLESHSDRFLIRELEILCAIRHPHLIKTHRIYTTPSSTLVFMEFCEFGNLAVHIRNKGYIPQWQTHLFFK